MLDMPKLLGSRRLKDTRRGVTRAVEAKRAADQRLSQERELRLQIDTLKKTHFDEIAQLQVSIATKSLEMDSLRMKNQAKVAEVEHLSAEVTRLQRQLLTVREDNVSAVSRVTSLTNKLRVTEAALVKGRSEVKRMQTLVYGKDMQSGNRSTNSRGGISGKRKGNRGQARRRRVTAIGSKNTKSNRSSAKLLLLT